MSENDAYTDVTYFHIVSCSKSKAENDRKLIIDKNSIKGHHHLLHMLLYFEKYTLL